jgi:hypothetical protein
MPPAVLSNTDLSTFLDTNRVQGPRGVGQSFLTPSLGK